MKSTIAIYFQFPVKDAWGILGEITGKSPQNEIIQNLTQRQNTLMSSNILQYESEIWATADLLRGCDTKESEWTSYMMPFFVLIMIESN